MSPFKNATTPQTTTVRFLTGTLSRFFLTVLIFAALSIFAVAQRYTVNRPVSRPAPPPAPLTDELPEHVPLHDTPVQWETDYDFARKTAKKLAKSLLIYLYADNDLPELPVGSACRKFDTVILDDETVRSELEGYVRLKLPVNAAITDEEGAKIPLLSLPGFEHMLEHPGLIVIDFASRDEPYYGQLTGILPFLRGECPTAKQTETFLTLPPGTLTQRTLVYAVRVHPDQPLSSEGEALPIVVQKATEHALYQAERGILGHQNFSVRSSQVKDVIGTGNPSEICAQSRSGESLFEGAIGCMRAWRYSSSHWSIARKSHRYYGYDMVQSDRNGCWYAVGFFMD